MALKEDLKIFMARREFTRFSRGGPKDNMLLQIELDYCGNLPAPENVFLGAGDSVTRS